MTKRKDVLADGLLVRFLTVVLATVIVHFCAKPACPDHRAARSVVVSVESVAVHGLKVELTFTAHYHDGQGRDILTADLARYPGPIAYWRVNFTNGERPECHTQRTTKWDGEQWVEATRDNRFVCEFGARWVGPWALRACRDEQLCGLLLFDHASFQRRAASGTLVP